MRHLLLALMGLLLLSVDVSAQELPLPNQIETVLRRRHDGHRCHRRHHSYSSANVIVGPTGPMGLPGIPGATGATGVTGATGSLASSYASVFHSDSQPIGGFLFPSTITFNNQELPPVNINYIPTTTTFDTLQIQSDGVYLIAWKLTMQTSGLGLGGTGFVVLNINTSNRGSTNEFVTVGEATPVSGQTIMRLNASDIVRLVAAGPVLGETTVVSPSLIITQIAQ